MIERFAMQKAHQRPSKDVAENRLFRNECGKRVSKQVQHDHSSSVEWKIKLNAVAI